MPGPASIVGALLPTVAVFTCLGALRAGHATLARHRMCVQLIRTHTRSIYTILCTSYYFSACAQRTSLRSIASSTCSSSPVPHMPIAHLLFNKLRLKLGFGLAEGSDTLPGFHFSWALAPESRKPGSWAKPGRDYESRSTIIDCPLKQRKSSREWD